MGYTRGDIYYVERIPSVGCEQRSGRPAVIVSNEKNNEYGSTVEIVYLTTQPKREEPTHVEIHATGVTSTALCEQVHTVDMQRLSGYCGSCNKEEIQKIDEALRVSLSLGNVEIQVIDTDKKKAEELIALKAQLDILQKMYDKLLVSLGGRQ